MCGILGAVGVKEKFDLDFAKAGIDTMANRGPNDTGFWSEGDASLAHCRLSVLDPTSAGHQPMVSPDQRYVLVFNGEIYNFRELREELSDTCSDWRSNSDSEVLLIAYARWGKEFLQHLTGMFALGIWDREKKSLFLARDRIGVKPLYYASYKGGLIFSSRPSALFAYCPKLSTSINIEGLALYLEAGYFPSPFTLYSSVCKLPAGHWLEYCTGKTETGSYWSPLFIEPVDNWMCRAENEVLDELDCLMTKSVRSRLVSDVPLGAFLSGGIDSSLVVALMRKVRNDPIKTFTIGFHEPQYDESRHAQAVANLLGTDHHQEVLSVDDLLALVPSFHQHFDEPFFDSSAFPALAVSRLARKEVTVVLGGDGGDELFGGYHYYSILRRLESFYRFPQMMRAGLARLLSRVPSHKCRLLASVLGEPDALHAFRFMRSIKKDFGWVLSKDVSPETNLDQVFFQTIEQMPKNLSAVECAMRLDLSHVLPEEYLQKTDLSSMAYSLEAREPLLDHELVEWSLKLPLSFKLRGGTSKYLLRRLASRYLPEEIINRPKQGFAVPIDRWLRGPLQEWARERIDDSKLYDRFSLDRNQVLKLFDLHLSGQRDVHPRLWAILMLVPFA
ncbi:asparagine synthase (glutamine-hydrolyzing) [Candidatus Nitronereus thalassa]|uniref:asparagine synthase (glutamine-hydrolyzing) n=1 Tax=Candidatus Nitronereus thalassa TaxID=3020898 RepID=A0ABU3K5H2_9BACT|nr:asparagine synthase (glutamine-hydrolyzing) [Candidatus Nitronereus thalassa]MDT7041659.1 asparagine synthase (glutamine-hydrolyzing) [Candidatus Nitronereus thalassa]